MIKPINLPEEKFMLHKFLESGIDIHNDFELFNEAVFTKGKETIAPIIEAFKIVKARLEERIENDRNYDGWGFYQDKVFQNLEEAAMKVFGVRDVRVEPYIEKYNRRTGEFESRELDCFTYVPGSTRFIIDGLVTEKGFYDKSHTMRLTVIISCGLIKACTPEEITAIFLHEMGHNIDPAAVDIRYMEINILSKYLTDRKGALKQPEKAYLRKIDSGAEVGGAFAAILLLILAVVFGEIKILFRKIVRWFKIKLFNEEKAFKQIETMMKYKQDRFDRVNNLEAFADNFSRMYGMGPHLITGLKKIEDYYLEDLSLIKREKERQLIITRIIASSLDIKSKHKTKIHRIHSLIREYEKDIKDPLIPKEVKKNLEDDVEELKKVLDLYLNHEDEFRKRIYNIIYDQLKKVDASIEKKEAKEGKPPKESEKDK
jgi:hypothetical protein